MDDELRALERVIGESRGRGIEEVERIAEVFDAYKASSAGDDEHDGFVERLKDSVDRLEATHPEMSAAFARIIDSLTAFGI